MSDRAAFIRAICERPRDDAPRLVFADWLDEFGDQRSDRDRAVFIRSQIAYARLPARCEVDPAWELADFGQPKFYRPRCKCRVCKPRMRSYYAGRRWVTWEWSGDARYEVPRWRRGFIHSVLADAREFRRNCLAGLLGQHPIMAVRVRQKPHEVDGRWHWYDSAVDMRDEGTTPQERARAFYAQLPDDIHEMMPSPMGRRPRPNGGWVHSYPTAEDAEHTLAIALIDFGRDVVGLPALGPPTTRPIAQGA